MIAPAKTVSHALYPVPEGLKKALLFDMLKETETDRVLIFTRTKRRARFLAADLEKRGYRVTALQGNMAQNRRQQAINGFREGKFDVLVATDIAARGIDVTEISHVINFDIPDTVDAYTHRIGRTGRAKQSGEAFTFITQADEPMVRDIERVLKMKIERCTLDGFNYAGFVPSRQGGGQSQGNSSSRGGRQNSRNGRSNNSRPSTNGANAKTRSNNSSRSSDNARANSNNSTNTAERPSNNANSNNGRNAQGRKTEGRRPAQGSGHRSEQKSRKPSQRPRRTEQSVLGPIGDTQEVVVKSKKQLDGAAAASQSGGQNNNQGQQPSSAEQATANPQKRASKQAGDVSGNAKRRKLRRRRRAAEQKDPTIIT